MFDVKPNAYRSTWGPNSGEFLSQLKKLGLPSPSDHVSSVPPKIPCTKTMATLWRGSDCDTQWGSVVLVIAVLPLALTGDSEGFLSPHPDEQNANAVTRI